MMQEKEKEKEKRPDTRRYRYRGVDYFREGDRDIFRGREEATLQLYTRLMLSKTLVLHAESGSGKSSLIQAGLIPLLKEEQPAYLVVTIRLDFSRAPIDTTQKPPTLLDQLIIEIKQKGGLDETRKLPFITRCKDSLWSLARSLAIKNADGASCKLLLILDQFEELQTFPENEVKEFKKGLFELLNSQIPADLYEQVRANRSEILKKSTHTPEEREAFNRDSKSLDAPLEAKAIFVVREDKLGTMSLLSDLIPDILKNDYILELLSPANALKAIVEPAQVDGDFKSSKFKFEDGKALEEKVAEIANDDTKMIDPIQLQIVCRSIEESLVIRRRKTSISKNDFPAVRDVIADFYAKNWDAIRNYLKKYPPDYYNSKRRSIIQLLVVNGSRNLVNANLLIGSDKPDEDTQIIVILRSKGLIREVISGRDKYYQLCHDRFIPPLVEDLNTLVANEDLLNKFTKSEEALKTQTQKYNYLVVLAIAFVCAFAFCLAYIFYIRSKKLDSTVQAELLGVVKGLKSTNPTLAYEVLKSYGTAKGSALSPDLKAYQLHLDTTNEAYLLYTFPVTGTLVQAIIQGDSKHIGLTDDGSGTGWDVNAGMIDTTWKLANESYVKLVNIRGAGYWIVTGDGYIDLRDATGHSYNGRIKHGNVKNIAVTSDGKYILLAEMLYDLGTHRLVGKLPIIKGKTNDLVVDLFLHDNKHIAAGYYSGYKAIYEIGPTGISTAAVFPPQRDQTKPASVITALAVDSKDSFLIAGNRNNNVEVWKLDSLDAFHKNGYPYQPSTPPLVLSGHTGEINTVAISGNDTMVLSGSKDHTAILWDLYSGNKIAILKGMNEEVVYTSFFKSGSAMVTSTKNGVVYIWGYGKANDLTRRFKLAQFTPFDYYNAEVDNKAAIFAQHYDTSDIRKLFSRTLHYISNIPPVNNHPDDEEYLTNLDYAIHEIDRMYASLTGNKDFNTISDPNKLILYHMYGALLERRPDLLPDKEGKGSPAFYDDLGRAAVLFKDEVLLGNAGASAARSAFTALYTISSVYRDSANYEKSIYYLKNIFPLLKHPFFRGISNHWYVRLYDQIGVDYLSWKKPDSALSMAERLDKYPEMRYGGNLLRINAYLEKNDYDQAVRIFNQAAYQKGQLDPTFFEEAKAIVLEKSLDRSAPAAVQRFDRFLKNLE